MSTKTTSYRASFDADDEIANLPVAASVAAYGSVLGVLAALKQISWTVLNAILFHKI